MILAVDSSTSLAGVALYNADGVIAEFSWLSHRDHTVQLLPTIQRMLDLAHRSPAALSAVAVATGPGSFNGLRVAVSAAKGLALALNLPIFGISSLDILAAQYLHLSGDLCALVEAGRGRYGVGLYHIQAGQISRREEYRNLALPELIEQIGTSTFVAGEIKTAERLELKEKLPANVTLLSPASSLRRPAFLAELAWQRLQSGDKGEDLASLQPIYLHQNRD